MHRNIVSVGKSSTLRQVIRVMKLHRLSAVPVVNSKGDFVGCITVHDILDASVPEYMKMIENTSFMANLDQVTKHLKGLMDHQATEFIDKKCTHISPDDSMSYAADQLNRNKRFILPVINNKKHVGWITKIDIISIPLGNEKGFLEIG